jgi:hypothetical protein
MVLTLEDYVGFKCSTPNVSQNNNERSWIDQCQFQTMHIPNLDINQWVKKISRINQT